MKTFLGISLLCFGARAAVMGTNTTGSSAKISRENPGQCDRLVASPGRFGDNKRNPDRPRPAHFPAIGDVAARAYIIHLSHTGYRDVYATQRRLLRLRKKNGLYFTMTVAGQSLDQVTVTSTKAAIEVRNDRIVLSVEGTINNSTGNDVLELLRKAPGITVDRDDNLSLSGKKRCAGMRRWKTSPLSGKDLSNIRRPCEVGADRIHRDPSTTLPLNMKQREAREISSLSARRKIKHWARTDQQTPA